MVVLHDSGKQQVNVDHKLNVRALLRGMEIAKVAKAISPANLITLACSEVGNTVVNGMVRAHSPCRKSIQGGMGFVSGHLKRVGPSRNKPLMKVLPQITIPLQGIGAPGPQARGSNNGASLVAECPAVGGEVNWEMLGQGSQSHSKLCSGAGPKATSKDTSRDSAIRDARGQGGKLHEVKFGRGEGTGAAVGLPHTEGRSREMPSIGPQLGTIAPHIGLTWWAPANGHDGGPGSRPGIIKVGAGELYVVKLAEAGFMRIGKVKSMGARNAFGGDANVAQKLQVHTFTSNRCCKVSIRHGIIGTRYAQKHVMWHIVDVQCSEVLSSLKPDSSMGGAVPELMDGGAMGVPQWGQAEVARGLKIASFSSKKLPKA